MSVSFEDFNCVSLEVTLFYSYSTSFFVTFATALNISFSFSSFSLANIAF